MGAALVVLVLAGTGAFFGMRSKTNETSATGITGKFTVGAKVDVASKTIGKSGSQVVVDANGGPLAGMTIDVPSGAYDNSRDFKVSYRPITASTYKDATPLGPLITVDNGGGYSTAPMTLKIPVTIPAGEYAVAVYYNETTGEIEPMPLVTEDATSITVLTAHFTDISIMQVVKSLTAAALSAIDVDSGFRPGADDWQFGNYGSYLQAGNCNAMSVTAMWYYVTQKVGNKAPQLNGLLDNNGNKPATPDIWQDDSWGYRYVSVLQTLLEPLERMISPPQSSKYSAVFTAVAFAIATTHRPQLLWIYGPDPTAADPNNQAGHAILAYQVKDNKIWISDPNTAGDTKRWIELVNGDSFAPYDGSETSDGKGQQYPSIYFIGNSGLVDLTVPAFYWFLNPGNRVTDGTIGTGYFPDYSLSQVTKTASGQEQLVPLKDGMTVSTPTITTAIDPAAWFAYWVNGTQSTAGAMMMGKGADKVYLDTRADLTLKPGPNRIGFWIVGGQNSVAPGQYIDFKSFTINYGGAVKISPNPATGQPDQPIKFTAEPLTLPGTPRWEWDFGDGTKVADGGVSQSHAYKKEGSYTLKVSVYDSYDAKTAKVVASGSVPVTITAASDPLAALKASKYMTASVASFVVWLPGYPTGVSAGAGGTTQCPVIWSGANFSCSYTDRTGWKVTYSGTIASDGKSLTSLSVTTSSGASSLPASRSELWKFANVGLTSYALDTALGMYWSAELEKQAAITAFVSGTYLDSKLGNFPIVSNEQFGVVRVAFFERPNPGYDIGS